MGFVEQMLAGDDFIRVFRFHRLTGDADAEEFHDEIEGARNQENATTVAIVIPAMTTIPMILRE